MNLIDDPNRPPRPEQPVTYIDDRHIMFVDAKGKYYFWNETHSNAVGPYDTSLECRYEWWKYGKLLEVGLSVNFPKYEVIEGFVEAVVTELLNKVTASLNVIDKRADLQIVASEKDGVDIDSSYMSLGFGLGARFARDIIARDLFPADDDGEEGKDG